MTSLIEEVKTKFKQTQTFKIQTEDRIIEIQDDLKTEKLSKKQRYNLNRKLKYFERCLSKDIVFGTKSLLRQISFLSNNKKLNKDKIQEKKNQYIKNRILPIYIIGNSLDKGNRLFDFNFIENEIIYKPNRKTKIEFNYKVSKKIQDELIKVQELCDLKEIPLTIRLSQEYINITYDEQKLYGFNIDEKERKKEIQNIKNQHLIKEQEELEIKKLYKKYYKIQEEKQQENKIKDRTCGIDLNPEYIGISIQDKDKIILKQCFDISNLTKKSNQSSSNKETKYLNNKRKHEISMIYKNIFILCKHFKVSSFSIEDLNFKRKVLEDNNKEFNRKVRNIWNLSFQKNLIQKNCNQLGIKLIEVNSCYSSFIGNIQYNYFDPINASIEIGRRGLNSFIKNNKLFPSITETNVDTMSKLLQQNAVELRDVQHLKNWKDWFNIFKQTGNRYRCSLDECAKHTSYKEFSMNNKKSCIKIYNFI